MCQSSLSRLVMPTYQHTIRAIWGVGRVGGGNLSFSGTVGVLEGVLLTDLLIEHLSLLRGRGRSSRLSLGIGILVNVGRRTIRWRVVIVVWSVGHVGRRGKGRRRVVSPRWRLLRRRIVIRLIHVVLLSGIRHFCDESWQ